MDSGASPHSTPTQLFTHSITPTHQTINTASTPMKATQQDIMNTIGGKTLINNNLPHTLISLREFDKDGMYTIFGGDKVIVTDTDPKPEPQTILIEGKVRNDLY
eukprot:Pgem_evm1s13628